MMVNIKMIRKVNTWPAYIYVGIIWAVAVYFCFAWIIYHDKFPIDFTSLYTSVNTLLKGINPYQVLTTDQFNIVQKLPANLNPPIVLTTFTFLHCLTYHSAMIVWYFMLIVFMFANFFLAGEYGCSEEFWRRYRISFLFIYLTLFSTIMGLAIGQLGTFIAFWILLGYHFYHNKAYHRCALCWGFITACKLFPAVLLIFCFQQRHYRLAAYYCLYGFLFSIIPLLFFGVDLYANYFDMMHRVLWYGDSWNASFFGLIGRLWIDTNNIYINLKPFKAIWLVITTTILIFYLSQRQMESKRSFILALVLMLMLSPFGWMYYFAVLFIALIYTAEKAEKNGTLWIWFTALVMMNLPVDYIIEKEQGDLLLRLSLFSVYFYGLLILMVLLISSIRKHQTHPFHSIRLPIIFNQALTLGICSLIILFHYIYYFR